MKNKLTLIPISEVVTPRSGIFRVYVNFWFIEKDEHIVVADNFVQCNSNKKNILDIRNKLYQDYNVIQIPYVYIPFNNAYVQIIGGCD